MSSGADSALRRLSPESASHPRRPPRPVDDWTRDPLGMAGSRPARRPQRRPRPGLDRLRFGGHLWPPERVALASPLCLGETPFIGFTRSIQWRRRSL